MAEVIVLARFSEQVMEPLTRDDDGTRPWRGRFEVIRNQHGSGLFSNGGWAIEFDRMRPRGGLLAYLEALPWPNPESVQVLIRDEEDDCFGLWMMHDGHLVEIELPRTQRFHQPAPPTDEFPPSPGLLARTDRDTAPFRQTPQDLRDPRSAW